MYLRCLTPISLMLALLASLGHGQPSRAKAPVSGAIVFSRQVRNIEYTHDGGVYDLFLQTFPGGRTVRLTRSGARSRSRLGGAVREPVLSPDGKRVLFLADYAGSSAEGRQTMTGASPYPYTLLNVWVLEISSRKATPLTKGDLGWHDPIWSPDGRYFAAIYPSRAGVIDQDIPIPDEIRVIDARTGKRVSTIRARREVYALLWSHDGRQLMYQNALDARLYAAPFRGGKSRVVVGGKGERYGYRLSPDGRRVAFIQGDRAYVATLHSARKPFAVAESGSGRLRFPEWSRDGRRLAVMESDGSGVSYHVLIHLYDIGTHKHSVPITIYENVGPLRWSSNGKWLLAEFSRGFSREGVLAVPITGGPVVILKESREETKGMDWHEGK